ncbi:hypothetical protein K8R20_00565 [bacterium]|nr:hypothetical protein [bacterium]
MKFVSALKKYWYLVTTVILILSLFPLYTENLYKVLIISSILITWCVLGIVLKKFSLASLLIIFLILPFNITYQLPYSLLGVTLSDPFVNGIIVNYLIPTLSILDLGVFLLLLSLIFEREVCFKWKRFSFFKIFVFFTIYLCIQNVLVGELVTVVNSLRLLLYLFTFYNLSLGIKGLLSQKVLKYLLILSLLLVLFQGVVALLQFDGGSSLGLGFLGESQVVSGMRGSSFLNLNNQLYLRGYGTFPHPNVFSGWLLFNMFFGWFLFERMKKKRDWSVVLMVVSSLVLLLTFSRIGFFVCILVWVGFLGSVFFKINLKGKSFGFVGLASERVLNLMGGGDSSWSERVDLVRVSLVVLRDNLLRGVGLGRFVSSMGEGVPRSSGGILLLQPVHNVFLLGVCELGLVGVGLLGSLLYFFLRRGEFGVRFVTVLIALFIIGMFDHYLFSLGQGMVLFLLLVVM